MEQGTIARLMDKGYGFIKRDGEEKDLFFHANELQEISFDELREGDAVSFEVVDGPKGSNAVKIGRAQNQKADDIDSQNDDGEEEKKNEEVEEE